MSLRTVQAATTAGVALAYAAADVAGDTFDNNGRVGFHVKNGGASPCVVTVNSVTACDQGFDHDLVVTVPAGSDRIIGPFPTARFGTPVEVTYDQVTSVTVAALRTS
jgi:hypothetical protein